MTTSKKLKEDFQSKKSSYDAKILQLEKENHQRQEKSSNLGVEMEKLKNGKKLLETLSGFLKERSKKADKIHKLINAGKDVSSLMAEVNKINTEIKDTKELLSSLNGISEKFSSCLINVLGENLSQNEISKALDLIDGELDNIKVAIDDNTKNNEKNNILKEKYEKCIVYINKRLDDPKLMNFDSMDKTLESDLVYKYAKEKGMEDVLNKMRERKLTSEEYENILIEANPIYAYIAHIINNSKSEIEKLEYYGILETLEKGTIPETDRKNLEEQSKLWILYREGGENLGDSTDNEITNRIIQAIPENDSKNGGIPTKECIINIKKIIEEINKLRDSLNTEDLEKLAKTFIDKGRQLVTERNPIFEPLRKRKGDEKVKKETGGTFDSLEEYNNFKSWEYHNSEEAMKFIESKKMDFLVEHLRYFKELDEKVFDKLLEDVENGNMQKDYFIRTVKENWKSFGLDIDKILIKFLDFGYDYSDIKTLLDLKYEHGCDFVCKLIECGYFQELEKLLNDGIIKAKFSKFNSDVAKLIIDNVTSYLKNGKKHNGLHYVATHLNYFENLDLEIKNKIENSEELGWLVYRYPSAFSSDSKETKMENYTTNECIEEIEIFINHHKRTSLDDFVKKLEQMKGLDYKKIFDKLLEAKQRKIIIDNIGIFEGVNHTYIVDELIGAGLGWIIPENLDKFEGVNHEELVNMLMDICLNKTIKNLDKFKGIDFNEIAIKLINMGIKKAKILYDNLEKFKELDLERFVGLEFRPFNKTKIDGIIDELIQWGRVEENFGGVAKNISSFKDKYHKEIAYRLIEKREGAFVAQFLNNFKGLTKQDKENIAIEIIKKGKGEYVIKYYENFEIWNRPQEAIDFVDRYTPKNTENEGVYKESEEEKKINRIIKEIEEEGRGEYVAHNIKKYKNVTNHQKIVDKLIEYGYEKDVLEKINTFKGIDYNELAKKFIDKGLIGDIVTHLKIFSGLDKEIADKLIEYGALDKIVEHLECFKESVFDKDIARHMIDVKKGWKIAENIKKFKESEHETVANILITKGLGLGVLTNINDFECDRTSIICKLIDGGYGNHVVECFGSFKNVNIKEIEKKLIDGGEGELVELYKNSNKESQLAKNIRNFYKQQHLPLKFSTDIKKMFHEYYGGGGVKFPEDRNHLFMILGGRIGCKDDEYLKQLLISKEAGDAYYKKYMFDKVREIEKNLCRGNNKA